ncbi:MAG: ABC transporter substrate-binding protein [Pseudomonadota bacterium]|nr:ABC transporter substrate-binding protein [Pseudomonadota bacterium]
MRITTDTLLVAIVAVAAFILPARADEASLGARIYTQGSGLSSFKALIAGGRVEAPGTRFPCVNCHKADGLGVLEGGLKPRNITWPALTRPRLAGGRGYDEHTLARAITEGLDAEGAPLGPGMPRYRLGSADLDAVIAYLREFDGGAQPGLSGESIRVATLLPLLGRQADTARAVERFLDLAVLDINTRRRFDGRRILRVSIPFDPDVPGDAHRAAEAAIADNPPFAFLSNYGFGPDDPARAAIAHAGAPDIAPIAVPLDAHDREAIWIEPSVADQARTLVETSATSPSMPYAQDTESRPVRLGLLAAADPESEAAAAAARDEACLLGVTIALDRSGIKASDVALLQHQAVDAVLAFGATDDVARLLEEADRMHWHPVLLGRSQQLSGIERDRVAQARATMFLVTSYGGVDARSRGAYDFRRVAGELGAGHPDLLRDAYVGVKLLEQTLAAVGPGLTRPRFIQAVAATSDFITGVMPPLSFGEGSSRRAASQVMWLDPARGRLVPLDRFHSP